MDTVKLERVDNYILHNGTTIATIRRGKAGYWYADWTPEFTHLMLYGVHGTIDGLMQHCSEQLHPYFHMSCTAKRLQQRLESIGIHLRPFRIARTYAGRHQKAAGSWSWALEYLDGGLLFPAIGSTYTASEVIEAESLSTLDLDGHSIEIFVESP